MVYECIGLYRELLRKACHLQFVEQHIARQHKVAELHNRTLGCEFNLFPHCLATHKRDLQYILSGTLCLNVKTPVGICGSCGNGCCIVLEQTYRCRGKPLGNILGIHHPALHDKVLRTRTQADECQ